MEYCANISYREKSIGEPIVLEETEMQKMVGKFKTYVSFEWFVLTEIKQLWLLTLWIILGELLIRMNVVSLKI